jgi:hypothetical protein
MRQNYLDGKRKYMGGGGEMKTSYTYSLISDIKPSAAFYPPFHSYIP